MRKGPQLSYRHLRPEPLVPREQDRGYQQKLRWAGLLLEGGIVQPEGNNVSLTQGSTHPTSTSTMYLNVVLSVWITY